LQRRAKKAANFPVYYPTACAASSAQWHRGLVHGGAGPGARIVVAGAHVIGLPLRRPPTVVRSRRRPCPLVNWKSTRSCYDCCVKAMPPWPPPNAGWWTRWWRCA